MRALTLGGIATGGLIAGDGSTRISYAHNAAAITAGRGVPLVSVPGKTESLYRGLSSFEYGEMASLSGRDGQPARSLGTLPAGSSTATGLEPAPGEKQQLANRRAS